MKRLLITSMIVALPFAVSCDRENRQEENVGNMQQQEEEVQQEEAEGRVIEESSRTIQQKPAELPQKEVEKGSANVEYTAKRKVTQTILKEQEIPTIQICESKADINQMDAKDFQALGFDQQTAQKIVQTREQQGSFRSVQDLSQIQGVSSNLLNNLQQDLGVGRAQAQEE
ncbi:MAG: ComEA family DNA-binding protein [Bacteriovoracia bacterium]